MKSLVNYFSLFFFFFIALCLYGFSFAETILIRDVDGQSFSEDIILAKENAIRIADRRAFEMLEYYLYPKFISGINLIFNYDDFVLLLSKFQINHESFSEKSYKVSINYYFDLDKVLSFFAKNIPNKENKLLIPAYCFEGNCNIWENEWFYSWKNASEGSNFFVIPEDIENVKNISIQYFTENHFKYLRRKYRALEIFLIKLVQENHNTFRVIIERPIVGQKKESLHSNLYNQSKGIFFRDLSFSMIGTLYDNLDTDKVLISNDSYFYHQITITTIKDWQEIKLILKKYGYIVQYVANDAVIIELRSQVDLKEINQLLKSLGYNVNVIDENRWVIGR